PFLSDLSDEGSLEYSDFSTPEGSPSLCPLSSEGTLESNYMAVDDLSTSSVTLRKTGSAPQDDVPVIRKVCVIGAGYVGGPTAAVLALHNPHIDFTVLDRDPARIRRWNSGHLPIREPGLSEVVRVARDGYTSDPEPLVQNLRRIDSKLDAQDYQASDRKPNLMFSTDTPTVLADADLVFLAVNTPPKATGIGAGAASDLSALEGAVADIGKYAKAGTIVVEKSTVPCGTAHVIEQLLSASRPQTPFSILSNPEFLSEGTALRNLLHPDRILIGAPRTPAGAQATRALTALYTPFIPRSKILAIDTRSAELAKLAANAFLAQRISSINSLSALCTATGADVHEVAAAVGADARIGPAFLGAGLGFGGSCFGKDIASLAHTARALYLPDVGAYWASVLEVNVGQRVRAAGRIIARLNNSLVRKKVTILGFAYKKGTGDTRDSLAVQIVRILLAERPAEIAIFDPACSPAGIEREIEGLGHEGRVKVYTDPYAACRDANALLVVTDWDMFRSGSAARGTYTLGPDAGAVPIRADDSRIAVVPRGHTLGSAPACADECPECAAQRADGGAMGRLDWARVAYHLAEPRYVLDGRGVLGREEMGRLGIEVEGLG
ncbi:nucleotide sugar dehydrogenase, partial [Trichodelitschia bisporula]